MSVPDKAMKLKDGKIIADQLSSMIAVQFVQATANAAGSYVVYNGSVYYLPDGHTAGTTWANTTKEGPTNIGERLSDVKSDIQGKYTKPSGGIPASDLAVGVIPDISGKIDTTEKGTANGVAMLDALGKVPSSQLPSMESLPAVSSADNGKILQVINGTWAAAMIPSANGVSF